MSNENPWSLTPERAAQVDKIRAEEAFLRNTFSDLFNQIEQFANENGFSNEAHCIYTPDVHQIDVITSGGEEFNVLHDKLVELAAYINNILPTQDISKICNVKITNACLTISIK